MKFANPRAVILLLLLAACVGIAAEDNSLEISRIEGRFERFVQNAAGTKFRVAKEVVGNQSSVATYDDEGKLVESHSSTIKVEKRGPVRVLSFFNLVVTAGVQKGHSEPGTSSYIYRMDGDTFTEVWGLLEGDSSRPRILEWRRVKETN